MELDQEMIPILFPDFDGAKVTETAEAVRATILKGLEHNNWLSSAARKEAINKIKNRDS